MQTPFADIRAESDRVLDGLTARRVDARLLGGLGVAAHDHVDVPDSLVRDFADIDLVVAHRANRAVAQGLAELGYAPNARFNSLHGAKRLLFYDLTNRRQLDVFVGEFAMCHRLDLTSRLTVHPRALSAADLLLTKLQIVELNLKDVLDTARLLLNHEITENDAASDGSTDGLSQRRIAEITATDWGWHTTLVDNLGEVIRWLPQVISGPDATVVAGRIDELLEVMTNTRKSSRWKARALVGRRKLWYELPEEVAGATQPARGTNDGRTGGTAGGS